MKRWFLGCLAAGYLAQAGLWADAPHIQKVSPLNFCAKKLQEIIALPWKLFRSPFLSAQVNRALEEYQNPSSDESQRQAYRELLNLEDRVRARMANRPKLQRLHSDIELALFEEDGIDDLLKTLNQYDIEGSYTKFLVRDSRSAEEVVRLLGRTKLPSRTIQAAEALLKSFRHFLNENYDAKISLTYFEAFYEIQETLESQISRSRIMSLGEIQPYHNISFELLKTFTFASKSAAERFLKPSVENVKTDRLTRILKLVESDDMRLQVFGRWLTARIMDMQGQNDPLKIHNEVPPDEGPYEGEIREDRSWASDETTVQWKPEESAETPPPTEKNDEPKKTRAISRYEDLIVRGAQRLDMFELSQARSMSPSKLFQENWGFHDFNPLIKLTQDYETDTKFVLTRTLSRTFASALRKTFKPWRSISEN